MLEVTEYHIDQSVHLRITLAILDGKKDTAAQKILGRNVLGTREHNTRKDGPVITETTTAKQSQKPYNKFRGF